MRGLQGVISFLLAYSAMCSAKESTASLLSKYKVATCLPFWEEAGHARYWKTTVSLRDGSKVSVHGAGFAGANWVFVSYPATGQEDIAAKPYDYVYPLDIRVDPQTDILYVAANGLAGGIWDQTWLFAFDLREHRQIVRRRIRYKDLPAMCPGPGRKSN